MKIGNVFMIGDKVQVNVVEDVLLLCAGVTLALLVIALVERIQGGSHD